MDDRHNRRNDFDAFFNNFHSQRDHKEHDRSANETTDESTRHGEKQSAPYYYSYGPFKSGGGERENKKTYVSSSNTSYTDTQGEMGTVDITRPSIPKAQWTVPKKKRSSFKSIFASFLAGALVISGLMFAADYTNLFTGNPMSAEQSSGNVNGAANSGGNEPASGSVAADSGVRSAALQNVVRPDNISGMVKEVSPAIVKIETKVKSSASSRLFNDPFFRQFFGDEWNGSNEGNLVPGGMGSGFIFDKSGYILTNQHVVDGAVEIYVTLEGYAEPFKAEMLGSSFELDLAVLKIKGQSDFPYLELGSSEALQVGDWVVAIGNPYGFDHTVTVGVLSAKERSDLAISDANGTRTYKHLLQTDASINPGNSGGPLLNLEGQVVGINTAVSTQAQGIGFAIPTSTITNVLDNLKNDVPIPRPIVGVELADLTEEGLKSLELEHGIVIARVVPNSPADQAGLKIYDVIIQANGQNMKSRSDLPKLVSEMKVGDRLALKVYRGGNIIDIQVTIGDANKLNL